MDPHTLAELRELVATLRALIAKTSGDAALKRLDDEAADAPTPLWLANDQGRFVWANRAATRLAGYSAAELLKLSVWDITPPSAETDLDRLWRTFLQSEYQSGVYPLRRKAGGTLWVDYYAEPHFLPHLHVSAMKRK